ncbi:MAG TPA: helix-turn-helix domain-containing protein [Methanospirillum sp.]|uniref:helix-turn-helix domain-containing protein n=1 Tax=Methanospirillum sp. TaxID=45200 RepID=UPI002C9AC1B3|nr:helix-turn-helix domain-containing protein [Methanospirillum sp.]HOJ96690.1 helix-turn-helix domain-containing protein [Methanospirillum sp.]HOL40318.1 helix-turn-helix domain-containing protein [Methanospirillum sp.]HPP79215.1 helix-turn-helix domain-containing protein [Methanospirillum sp.]
MSHLTQTITLSLSPDIINRLNHFASEQHIPVEDVARDLLTQALHIKRHESTRIVSPDRKGHFSSSDHDVLREIIQRQDEEISWLRDQITRLITQSPTPLLIRSDYPPLTKDQDIHGINQGMSGPARQEQPSIIREKEPEESPVFSPHVSVEDVQYSLSETGIDSEDLISPVISGQERGGDRTLRDSIGGVREEMMYTIAEAAAIAGESESVLLEYITDGFLPAVRDGPDYRIRGVDLRRYMMSR